MILNSPYITGSLTVTGDATIAGNITVTGSLSGTAATASFALTLGGTGSVGFATTGAFSATSGSASSRLTQIEQVYATTGSNSFRATQSITGSLTVTGQIIAQTLNVQQVTSSIVYSSGSNVFGCDINSRQTFTGSVFITGSCHMIYGNVAIGSCATSASLMIKSSGANGIFMSCDTTNADVSSRLLFESCRNQYAIFNSGGNLQFNYGATLIATSGTNGFYMSSDGSVTFQSRINGTMGYFANCIGIGTNSPYTVLDIGTATPRIRFWNSSANTQANIRLGGMYASNAYSSANAYSAASIDFYSDAAWYKGYMTFSTNDSDSTANAAIERMRITTGGSVGIGTCNPSYKLDVAGTINATGAATFSSTLTTSGNITANSSTIYAGSNNTTRIQMNADTIEGYYGASQYWALGRDSWGSGCAALALGGTSRYALIGAAPGGEVLRIALGSTIGDGATCSQHTFYKGVYAMLASTGGTNFNITYASGKTTLGMDSGGTDGIYYRMYNGGYADRFYVLTNGNYYFSGTNVSDIRTKENICAISMNAINKLSCLVAKSFNTIGHPDQKRYGFIAQEVRNILPDIISGNEETETIGLDYNSILSLTVKAIQELKAENDVFKTCLGIA
jgi:hypothetical protein